MTPGSGSALYEGLVVHHRRVAPAHRFRYPLYMLWLDLAELSHLTATLRLFGAERRRVVSFRAADHLDGAGRLERQLVDLVTAAGVPWPGGPVRVLTHARVLGYVFNPVTFFFCYDTDQRVRAVVAEVNSTFGDRHAYVLPAAPGAEGGGRVAWRAKKVMHVSPFQSLDGTYAFSIEPPGERARIRIALTVGGARRFDATLALERRPLTDASLGRMLARYPLMTVQVIGAIHWEALRLWRKRAPFWSQPPYDPESARKGVA